MTQKKVQALDQLILIQRQMIRDLQVLQLQQDITVQVLASLEPNFLQFYLAQKLQSHLRDLGSDDDFTKIPSMAMLTEALKGLGWDGGEGKNLGFWTALSGSSKDPWSEPSREPHSRPLPKLGNDSKRSDK